MNLKKVRYLIYTLAAALFVTAMAAYWFHSLVLGVIAACVCMAIVVVELALWRCPYCGGRPGRIEGRIKFCPHCGKKLDDLE